MAFDNELYDGCKQIASNMLHNIPFQYGGTIEDWVLGSLSMIGELNMEESYEGAKAIKDAVNEKYFKPKQ